MERVARFRNFAVAVLVYTLLVILWGAYVRATGSGAGCGSHWPTCNGQIIPRAPTEKTIIEFTHRVTSGLALVMVFVQFAWARKVFPLGHGARRAAVASAVLIVTEALVGAGLIFFEMVAENTSTARAAWMGAHLLNTFALLAALALVYFHTRWGHGVISPAGRRGSWFGSAIGIGIAVMSLVAVSGAIAALGDTLFPSASLAEGWKENFSPTAHLFIRLRVWHPLLASLGGLYVLIASAMLAARVDDPTTRRLAMALVILVLAQIGIGIVNLVLLAPTAMQIIHLLFADLLWLTLIMLRAAERAHAVRAIETRGQPAALAS